ncbi:hypothetical protein [Sedimenticola hydrogenitrophicus]|uniref:hypothetical protein n=1 Tax=Sedimenticola hydrogenitrophicus TaxID=2967975 RepID=UPI0023AF3BFF|nr:hypothetical protein [Sedimenticola hydrogenitrophicus]
MNVNEQRQQHPQSWARRVAELEGQLVERYAPILRIEDVADVLAISRRAAQVADQRGALPIKMKKIPNRRDKIVSARLVAEYLVSLEKTV